MDILKEMQSLYLANEELIGKEVTLTVRRVLKETVKSERGEETKNIIFFEELYAQAEARGEPNKQRRLVIGKTFALDAAQLLGKETDTWPGRKITLYRGKAIKGGKDCIRAKAATQSQSAHQPETESKETV